MAYNLPPPWDPGFALPQNVRDEGLQRRGFVTKQMPRGSYDNPSVGYGGFTVPQYVKDEGYGQGTFTTKWMPSGTYVGPKIPPWLNQRPMVARVQRMPGGGEVVTVHALGDDDAPMPAIFTDYGQRAAAALISSAAKLPPGQRQQAMRLMMDRVDRSLWGRTQTIAKRYVAQGAAAQQAWPQALARALSTGIAAELIDTGLKRQPPQANSLLGLGCYGPVGLGVIRQDGPVDPIEVPQPPSGPAPKQPTGIAGGTGGTPPAIIQLMPLSPTDRIKVAGLEFNPSTLTRIWALEHPDATYVNRAGAPDIQFDDPSQIPPDFGAFLHDYLVWKDGMPKSAQVTYMGNNIWEFNEVDRTPWFYQVGILPDTKLNKNAMIGFKNANMQQPMGVHNLFTGEDMGFRFSLAKRDFHKDWNAETNPLVLKVWLSRVPDKGFWATIINAVIWLPVTVPLAVAKQVITPVAEPVVGAVGTVIKDGLNKLGDLACEVLGTPGVAQAAGADGGTAAGVGPVAGAAAGQAGAAIAKGQCGGQPPPPPPPPPVPQTNILPLALLAGGVVLAAVMLSKPSKKRPPP